MRLGFIAGPFCVLKHQKIAIKAFYVVYTHLCAADPFFVSAEAIDPVLNINQGNSVLKNKHFHWPTYESAYLTF